MRPEKLTVDICNVLAGCGVFICRGFAVVETNHFDLPHPGNRDRFQFRAGGPTTGKTSAVEVDQYAVLIPCRNTSFRRVNVGAYSCDCLILSVNRKRLVV